MVPKFSLTRAGRETTLITPGNQAITVRDDIIAGGATVTVTDGGAPQMGHGNCWNPMVDQCNLDFRDADKPNWTGYVFDSPIEGTATRDRRDLLFLDDGLDLLELAIY
jgi:hypothetical protein